MRITNSMMISTLLRNLNGNYAKLSKFQEQMASGRRINRASDDPVGIVDSLRLRNNLYELEKYKKNSEDAISWLDTTDNAMNASVNVLHRVRELTLQAANDTLTANEREDIAKEVRQLKAELVQIANTKYANRSIFSGTMTRTDAFDVNGTYLGNTGVINYEISPGARINVNTNGQDAFGHVEVPGVDTLQITSLFTDGDTINIFGQVFTMASAPANTFDGEFDGATAADQAVRLAEAINRNSSLSQRIEAVATGDSITFTELKGKAAGINLTSDNYAVTGGGSVNVTQVTKSVVGLNVFQTIDSLLEELKADDAAAISSRVNNISDVMENQLRWRADIGARVNRLELAITRADELNFNMSGLLSQTEDVDMAELIIQLKVQENVYNASLSSGARIIQPTLLDFLR